MSYFRASDSRRFTRTHAEPHSPDPFPPLIILNIYEYTLVLIRVSIKQTFSNMQWHWGKGKRKLRGVEVNREWVLHRSIYGITPNNILKSAGYCVFVWQTAESRWETAFTGWYYKMQTFLWLDAFCISYLFQTNLNRIGTLNWSQHDNILLQIKYKKGLK